MAIGLAWAYNLTPSGVIKDWGSKEEASAPTLAGGFTIPPEDRRAIAVLPFTRLSSDPENEFFADGVTDDILRLPREPRGAYRARHRAERRLRE